MPLPLLNVIVVQPVTPPIVTSPFGVPLLLATVTLMVIVSPGLDGSGSCEVMVVVVLTLATVCSSESLLLAYFVVPA